MKPGFVVALSLSLVAHAQAGLHDPSPVLRGKCGSDYYLVSVAVSKPDPAGGWRLTNEDWHLRDSQTLGRVELESKVFGKVPYYQAIDQGRNRLITIQPIDSFYVGTLMPDYTFSVFEDLSNPGPISKGICSNWSGDFSPADQAALRERLDAKFKAEGKKY